VSNAQDLEAAKQAARDIPPLELLAEQADADLRGQLGQQPAAGSLL
jgi:hypothetical protein